MRRKFGIICMFLGTVLILLALSLVLFNRNEDKKAGESAEDILSTLQDRIPDPDLDSDSDSDPDSKNTNTTAKQQNSNNNQENAEYSSNLSNQDQASGRSSSSFSMPQTAIGGYGYIGYLSIPALNRELPVMAEWSYPRLRISPCRFSGSVETDDLVILAHNYSRHFGKISSLKSGDLVVFTNVNGLASIYEVAEIDTLNPTAVEEMTSGEYPLTLFTCTYGGQSRVTVRCIKA